MNRSPISPMSAKRRAQLAAQGIHHPLSTLVPKTPTGGGSAPASAGGGASDPARGLARSPMKQSRPKPAVPADVRDALQERSSGWCEAQLPGCWAMATDPHHRVIRQRGGRHGEAKQRSDRLSGLVYLCRPCHDWAHAYPAISRPMGLLLKQHHNPTQVPVRYRGRLSYLDDAGEVHEYEAHCA